MVPSPEHKAQNDVAEDNYQVSGIQATIGRNRVNHDTLQTLVGADDPCFHTSTESKALLSTTQSDLHSKYRSPMQSSASLAIPSEEFISSSVFFSYRLYQNQPPDATLYSSDGVCFYTHTFLLLSASNNNFGGLIHDDYSTSSNSPLILSTVTPSDVLEIGMCVIYDLGFSSPLPSFSTFENAVRFLDQHGIAPLFKWIGPESRMFTTLTNLAPQNALELYTLGAEFDIESLAVHASSFLLGTPISSIPEEMAERIGGIYIRRLGSLQISRTDALKEILLPEPLTHLIEGDECSEEHQRGVGRLYALTASYVIWNANADLPASFIEETFGELRDMLKCPMCKDGLDRRTKESIEAWTTLKVGSRLWLPVAVCILVG